MAASAAKVRDQSLAELAEREAAALVELERVNEPALSKADDQATDAMFAVEDAILALELASPDVVAMQIMLRTMSESREDSTIDDGGEMEIAALAFRGLLPLLTGEIATDAAEFSTDRNRPLGHMRAWTGIGTVKARSYVA